MRQARKAKLTDQEKAAKARSLIRIADEANKEGLTITKAKLLDAIIKAVS